MDEKQTALRSDLLSLFVGALVVDTVIIGMNYYRIVFVSDVLTRWYTTCRASAMAMDTLIIVLYATAGLRLAALLKKKFDCRDYSILDLFCIVTVQLVGDLLFYTFFEFAVPRGTVVFDIFKDYAVEVGAHALWADAVMMVGTYLVARMVTGKTTDTKLLALVSTAYVSQYVLFLK